MGRVRVSREDIRGLQGGAKLREKGDKNRNGMKMEGEGKEKGKNRRWVWNGRSEGDKGKTRGE